MCSFIFISEERARRSYRDSPAVEISRVKISLQLEGRGVEGVQKRGRRKGGEVGLEGGGEGEGGRAKPYVDVYFLSWEFLATISF